MIRWLLAVLAAFAVLMGGLLLGLHVSGSGAPKQSKPTQAPATPAPSPTSDPMTTADAFGSVYFTYDWQHPLNYDQELRPLTTARLHDSLITDGVTPQGRPVPWSSARPDLHELDRPQVVSSSAQTTSPGTAVVRMVVVQSFHTDVGQGNSTQNLDLTLQQQGGTWRVDTVAQTGQ